MWLLAFSLFSLYEMVKLQDFKTVDNVGFAQRQMAYADLVDLKATKNATYSLVPGSAQFDERDGKISAKLMGIDPTDVYVAEFQFLENNMVHFTIVPRDPLHPKYRGAADFAIDKQPKPVSFQKIKDTKDEIQVNFGASSSLVIFSNPFKFELAVGQVPVVSFNERNYFYFETDRKKEDTGKNPVFAVPKQVKEGEVLSEQESRIEELKQKVVKDYWEESFNGNTDSKPKGPASIGLDITFPGSSNVYGLPEHATGYSLKSTRGPDAQYNAPYRLYNLDVFEHDNDNPMALYGSIPFMMSHKKEATAGVLWLNAAEMWVDVEKTKGSGSKLSLLDYVPFKTKSQTSATSVETHWMVESGVVDMYFFLGPSQKDIFNAYTLLTGRPQLPQHFATAYHQCRWNYISEDDALEVDANFDIHDIPYDVLWLDIEHTDGKKYFTWDDKKFGHPLDMQKQVSSKGRKMVTIIDPHIKKANDYYVSKEAAALDVFVKRPDGSVFDGHCWPGDSNWIDYTNEKARQFWASKFAYDQYKGSTPDLYTWNDMNEPSVFTGPEITMPKDMIHAGGVEHRDVHNLYGMLLHRSTFEGHLHRSNNNDRPFILSRAFFAGTQRYGAIWTGDNAGKWDYIALSVSQILTIGISGVTFAGSDVGGFFGNPEPEMLLRWYQVGAFQPFFRAHAELTTKRREPWLFGEPWTSHIREAVRRRYRLLPYIYTLFAESHLTGLPINRAMMYEYPEDPQTFAMDDQFMLGSALLIKPVVQQGQSAMDVYLGKDIWYEYETLAKVSQSNGILNVQTPMDKIPVFLRGGHIVPRRDRVRRSSSLTKNDPYTLLVALDKNEEAAGTLYVDDGKTFDYKQGKYLFEQFEFKGKVLRAFDSRIPEFGEKRPDLKQFANRVERIVITGLSKEPKSITAAGKTLDFQVVKATTITVTIKNPPLTLGTDFELKIE
ncbi:glycosyl hydrolases family 31-domain-containing protein [Gorgonomyces haynaldii]|nr:glycosyl hydrolases family 31-domain-containing protein [Gorgonomyces haynaldii]